MNSTKCFDIVIIGGGPAGMSAALWCSDLGLRAILIEKNEVLGGQLSIIHNPIRNYLGLTSDSGDELRKHFLNSLDAAKFDVVLGRSVVGVNLRTLSIEMDDASTLEGRALIIATGVRRRKLGVPGEDEFYGNGLLASGAKDVEKVKGKNVVIVGGGDAAIENALVLSKFAGSVTVVHRRAVLRARKDFVDRLQNRTNVTVMTDHAVKRFEGDRSLRHVVVRSLRDGSTALLPCDFGLIRIGVQPNSEIFRSQLEAGPRGYLQVDSFCLTSVANVYAVGDVANPESMTVATAAGNSATAVSHFLKQKTSS